MMMIGTRSSRLHFSCASLYCHPPKPSSASRQKDNASEGGSRTHGTFSPSVPRHECPVGRSLSRAPSHFGGANPCGFCPAWISDLHRPTGPDEPGQSPTRMVSGYSLRLGVLPNPALPTRPADGPQCSKPPSSFRFQPSKRRTGSLDPAYLAAGDCSNSTSFHLSLEDDSAGNARADLDFRDSSVSDLVQ
jgi:hypothetical protein